VAITTASQLQALLPYRRLVLLDKTTNSTQPGAGNWGSHWTSAGGSPAGATPTAAAVCDNTTPGALSMPSPGAGETLYLCSVERATLGLNGFAPVSHLIYDRLVHSGGLSAVVTTALAGSTVVAGNFGVTLARHHCWFPLGSGRGNDARSYDWMDLGLPIIEANACLALASSIASGASRYGVNCNLGFLSA
jgi:hypothetical protein